MVKRNTRGERVDKHRSKTERSAIIKTVIAAVIVVVVIRLFLVTPASVSGASMMPTFENGDYVLVDRIGPKLYDYNRFDVVVFKTATNGNYIKRIIGLPGDRIEYVDDELWINGKRVDEPYLDEYKGQLMDGSSLTRDFTLEEALGKSVVPEGHYFVMGDNRKVSIDSRDPEVGFVSEEAIVGKASVVFWPFNHAKLLKE